MIVTRVSGVPYQEYIDKSILDPLQMTDTYWEYDMVPAERLARGYRAQGEGWSEVPLLHDGIGGAMGGMITTIEDFCKYMSFHLSAWPPRDTEESGPLKRSSLREMHQCWRFGGLFPQNRTRTGETCPSVTGYGFGLGWRKDCRGITRISHTGGLPGFGSIWAMYPEYGIAVAAFSNYTYGAPSRPSLIMLDTLIQLAGLSPRSLAPSAILKKRQDEIVSTLTTWAAEDSTLFTGNFFIDQSLAEWRRHCATVFESSGKILDVGEVAPENQLRGTFIMKGEKASVSVYFTLAPEAEARVQELSVELVDSPQ
jgi:CubicO group peptidase (beta-lactamase class C family)